MFTRPVGAQATAGYLLCPGLGTWDSPGEEMVAREEDPNLFRLGAGVRVSPSPEGDLSDPGREGPGAGCPGGPRRGSRPRVRAAAPRKEPRTPLHAVPTAAAADPEVRAPRPRSPPSPCAARPGAGGRARIGARWGGPLPFPQRGPRSSSRVQASGRAPCSSAAGCGLRARAGAEGRGLAGLAGAPAGGGAGAGTQAASAPLPAAGRGEAGRAGGGGRGVPGRLGDSRRAGGRRRGRGEPPAPRRRSLAPTCSLGRAARRPPPEKPPPLRASLPGAPASLGARCCSRPPRPPKRSPGPGRTGDGGAGRGGRGRGAGRGARPGTLSRRWATPAALRRGARKVTSAAFAGCGKRSGHPGCPACRAGAGGRGLGQGAGLRLGPRGQRNFSFARQSLLAAGGVAGGNSGLVGGVPGMMMVVTIAASACGEPTVCSAKPLLALGGKREGTNAGQVATFARDCWKLHPFPSIHSSLPPLHPSIHPLTQHIFIPVCYVPGQGIQWLPRQVPALKGNVDHGMSKLRSGSVSCVFVLGHVTGA